MVFVYTALAEDVLFWWGEVPGRGDGKQEIITIVISLIIFQLDNPELRNLLFSAKPSLEILFHNLRGVCVLEEPRSSAS